MTTTWRQPNSYPCLDWIKSTRVAWWVLIDQSPLAACSHSTRRSCRQVTKVLERYATRSPIIWKRLSSLYASSGSRTKSWSLTGWSSVNSMRAKSKTYVTSSNQKMKRFKMKCVKSRTSWTPWRTSSHSSASQPRRCSKLTRLKKRSIGRWRSAKRKPCSCSQTWPEY